MKDQFSKIFLSYTFFFIILTCSGQDKYPDPESNPESPLMLSGDWFNHPHTINFDSLPRVKSQHVVVSDVSNGAEGDIYELLESDSSGGVNQHNYLKYYDDKFWLMWSDGPSLEDRVGQIVKYAVSSDGLNWSEPKQLTPFPPGSDPQSPIYNTRSSNGLRWISRGFWVYEGNLLALASLDEAGGFFGPNLELRSFVWDKVSGEWKEFGVVKDNAINNFPPKKLPSGEWLMSRRSYDYNKKGVEFLVGGVEAFNKWESYPVLKTESELDAEEPFWWILPDNENLVALFRDNKRSGYLYRSFSTDFGRTWTNPVKTNFPDARSKFHVVRLKDGRYVMVSNANPTKRDPLVLSISEDGLVFNKMMYLVGGRHVDYPCILEHDGFILIAFSGSTKQKIEVLKIKISDLNELEMSLTK